MARLAVVGLGKVGLPLACHLTDLGHTVSGYDKNRFISSMVADRINPYPWERLGQEKDAEMPPIKVITDLKDGLKDVEAVLIVVPTPLEKDRLSSALVTESLNEIEAALSHEIICIVVSTLDPRDADIVCKSRKLMDIGYNPPLIRLGRVRDDLGDAAFVFAGGSPAAIKMIEDIYEIDVVHRVIRGSCKTIAAAKLAINATLSARTAWANDIAFRCEGLGVDKDVVLRAVGLDPRIGSAYMKDGPPPGGPCLPRDMKVWESLQSTAFGITLPSITILTHERTMQDICGRAANWVSSDEFIADPKVAVLGLTYNPGGLDVTDAVGPAIYRKLLRLLKPGTIRTHDPAGKFIQSALEFPVEEDVVSLVKWADLVIICTAWDEYRSLEIAQPTLFLDWRGNIL